MLSKAWEVPRVGRDAHLVTLLVLALARLLDRTAELDSEDAGRAGRKRIPAFSLHDVHAVQAEADDLWNVREGWVSQSEANLERSGLD